MGARSGTPSNKRPSSSGSIRSGSPSSGSPSNKRPSSSGSISSDSPSNGSPSSNGPNSGGSRRRQRTLSRRPLVQNQNQVFLNQSQTNIINQDQEIVAAPAEPRRTRCPRLMRPNSPGPSRRPPRRTNEPSSAQPPPAQPEPARRMRLGVTTEAQADQPGLVIRQVFDGFPAAASGLEAGDVILAVNGHAMRAWDMLNYAIDTAPGVVRCVVRDVRTGQVSYLDIPLAR